MNEQRFCTSCGKPVAGMRFCTNCGTPVTSASAMPAPAASPPTQPPPTAPAFVQTAPEPAATWTQQVKPPTAGSQQPPQQPPQQAPQQPPRGTYRPRWSASTRSLWVMGGAAVVLLVGGGAFALGSLANDGHHHGVTPPTRLKDPTHPGSGPVDPASPEGIARSISSLMADSRMDKSEIGRAASDLRTCRNVDAGVRTFDDARKSRQRLVDQAKKVDASGLRGGRAVVDELTQAWSIAADADAAYAKWGRLVHRAHGRCVGNEADLRRATDLSDRSHPHKQAAATAWNSIARKYDLPSVKWDQL